MIAPESKLEAALQYAVEYGWAVLPLWWITSDGRCACGKPAGRNHKPGKHPIGKLVPNGHKNATKDPALIRSWWKQYPEANVGIVMGDVSGVFAIDLDGTKGHKLLIDVHKANNAPPCKTLIAQSGRGPDGHHVIYKLPPGEHVGRVLRKELGVDIIGNGGYIVAPPSNHVSGGTYRWSHDFPVVTPEPWLMEWVRTLFDKSGKTRRVRNPTS